MLIFENEGTDDDFSCLRLQIGSVQPSCVFCKHIWVLFCQTLKILDFGIFAFLHIFFVFSNNCVFEGFFFGFWVNSHLNRI